MNLTNPLLIPNKRGRKPGTKAKAEAKNDLTPSETFDLEEESNSDDLSDDEQKKIRRFGDL